MKIFFILLALVFTFCQSFASNKFKEILSGLPETKVTTSVSCNEGITDYSQYTLLTNRTIMPRNGRSYSGYISYKGCSFPIFIFWNTNFEYHNLYAYIAGPCESSCYCNLYHVATYDSESTEHKYWFVIKCDYSIHYSWGGGENLYVSFRVSFDPNTQFLTCDVIEEGPGSWSAIDREID